MYPMAPMAPYPYNNPAMQSAQQRLQMMEAQYPQMGNSFPQQPPQQPQTPAAPILKGRPVSNEEEANAAMIDFDGSLFVFPDKAHGKIYTKQLGLDGNIIFQRYSVDNPVAKPVEASPQTVDLSGYVREEDFNAAVQGLTEKLSKIEQKLKGGNKQ